jgi:integrase
MAKKIKEEVKKVRGVFERPADSNIWWIQYFDAEGKRHREKVGRRSDAIGLYQTRKTDIRRGVKLPERHTPKAILFKEIADDMLEISEKRKASYPAEQSTVNKLLPTFGELRVANITHQMIEEYLDARTDLKDASKNRYRGTLSVIFNGAIKSGKATSNPARLVTRRAEDNSRIRYITYPEEDLIRREIRKQGAMYEPSFVIAIETGMRRSEQHTLNWDQVDLDRRQLFLPKTKNGAARAVILTVPALEAFQTLLAVRNPKFKRVFMSRFGEPLTSPRSWFDDVMDEAVKEDPALSDVTWHICRHTYISRLVMAGVDIKTVATLCGHKTLQMTMRYAHLSPSHLLSAVDKLEVYRAEEEARIAKEAALQAADLASPSNTPAEADGRLETAIASG